MTSIHGHHASALEAAAVAPAVRALAEIESFHIHVYYDQTTRSLASLLRERIAARFAVDIGTWWDIPIGPHPIPQYQVAFSAAEFATLVPWLALNRLGLSILVHPNTDRELDDHESCAMWLGPRLQLCATGLHASLKAANAEAHSAVQNNTAPTVQP